jgi:hypothetical protein
MQMARENSNYCHLRFVFVASLSNIALFLFYHLGYFDVHTGLACGMDASD